MCMNHATPAGEKGVPSYKLPTSVTPTHYRVRQMPNFGTFTFAG